MVTDIRHVNMIPIPLGKSGRQSDYMSNSRVTIHPQRRRIAFPKSVWDKFNNYDYIELFTDNMGDLYIRFSPVKNSRLSTTHVKVQKNGRVEFNISRRMVDHLYSGRYLFIYVDGLVKIENCIKPSYKELLKSERSERRHKE